MDGDLEPCTGLLFDEAPCNNASLSPGFRPMRCRTMLEYWCADVQHLRVVKRSDYCALCRRRPAEVAHKLPEGFNYR